MTKEEYMKSCMCGDLTVIRAVLADLVTVVLNKNFDGLSRDYYEKELQRLQHFSEVETTGMIDCDSYYDLY